MSEKAIFDRERVRQKSFPDSSFEKSQRNLACRFTSELSPIFKSIHFFNSGMQIVIRAQVGRSLILEGGRNAI